MSEIIISELDKYIEFANKNSTQQQLEFLLKKIPERGGFNNLLQSQYIFLIKVYIGKILELYDASDATQGLQKTAAVRRILHILENKNIDLEDYSGLNYDSAIQDCRSTAIYFITVYKNIKQDRLNKHKDNIR